jgi:hypothetical protein
MNLFAVGAAEQSAGLLVYSAQELERLYLAVIVVFSLPVVVLVATTARLSAVIRDRRLATLRLLGLSPGQTRLVAGVEAATVSGLGTVVGVALFYVTRPLVQASGLAGREWEHQPFSPSPPTILLILLLAPLVSVLVSLVPTTRMAPLARARRAEARRPSLWRLLPLLVGVLLVGLVTRTSDDTITNQEFATFMAGVVLVGLGVLLCVPMLVRLLAELLLRSSRRPTARIAGRRLQAQPAGVSRVVSGMLIGLFVVSGAQCIIVAFAVTYHVDEIQERLDHGPAVFRATLPPRQASALDVTTDSLRQVDGVRRVFTQDHYLSSCNRGSVAWCLSGVVATCADLESLHPEVDGCDDSQVAWLGSPPSYWRGADPTRWREDTEVVSLPAPSATLTWPQFNPGDTADGDVFIPLQLVEEHLGRPSGHTLIVVADKDVLRADLAPIVRQHAPAGYVESTLYLGEYKFVRSLQATAWTAAGVILAIGLFTFAISAIDRAVSRRQEVVGLQVLGTPPRVLRAAQWLESLLSIGVGLPLAVALGWWCGRAYLGLVEEGGVPPREDLLSLAGVSLVAAIVVAALTVVAASPRIRPDLIRTT